MQNKTAFYLVKTWHISLIVLFVSMICFVLGMWIVRDWQSFCWVIGVIAAIILGCMVDAWWDGVKSQAEKYRTEKENPK